MQFYSGSKKRGNDDKKKKEVRKFEIVEYNIDAIDLRVQGTNGSSYSTGWGDISWSTCTTGLVVEERGTELMFLLFFSFSLDDPTPPASLKTDYASKQMQKEIPRTQDCKETQDTSLNTQPKG